MAYYRSSSREELGYVPSDPETNRKILEHFKISDSLSLDSLLLQSLLDDDSERVPEELRPSLVDSLEIGEIKKRLSKIRRTGYPLKPYNHMGEKEIREYFLEVRREILEKRRQSS